MFVLHAPITPDDCECLCRPRVTKAAHSARCFLWAAEQKRRSPQSTLRSTMTKSSFCIYTLIDFAKASKLLQSDFALLIHPVTSSGDSGRPFTGCFYTVRALFKSRVSK